MLKPSLKKDISCTIYPIVERETVWIVLAWFNGISCIAGHLMPILFIHILDI